MLQLAFFCILVMVTGCGTPPNGGQPVMPSPTAMIERVSPTTSPVLQDSSAAINAARLRLTKNGLENPNLVSVVQVTPTTWPDDCLGLPSATACQPIPTPGYAIEAEREGQTYLVRTDRDGKRARLARAPVESISDVFVQWQYSDGQDCRAAVIGADRMQYGPCGEAMLSASSRASMWPEVGGQSQASYLRQTYAPFTASTSRGSLVFTGTGTSIASKAEQRSIAEWALARYDDASHGYLSADYSLTLYWFEDSGSLCGGLWVYQDGLAVAWNCEGTKELGVGFLPAKQLQQFYQWLDSGKRWSTTVGNGQTQRSRPSVALQFPSNSKANENATAEETEQMLRFAREVYVGLAGRSN